MLAHGTSTTSNHSPRTDTNHIISQIDYDALAKKCGMKDHTAAYKVLWAIKKKLATHGDGAPTTPKKAAKRGATDGDGKNSAKKRKTPVKSAQKGKLAEVGDENDDEIKDEMKEEEEEEDAAAV